MRRFAKPNLKRNAAASVIAAKMVGKRRLRWTDLSCCKIAEALTERSSEQATVLPTNRETLRLSRTEERPVDRRSRD